jgi:hypothetical protein
VLSLFATFLSALRLRVVIHDALHPHWHTFFYDFPLSRYVHSDILCETASFHVAPNLDVLNMSTAVVAFFPNSLEESRFMHSPFLNPAARRNPDSFATSLVTHVGVLVASIVALAVLVAVNPDNWLGTSLCFQFIRA